jgi:sulfatase maturation enzyme AslB (radical SAM superfamily)
MISGQMAMLAGHVREMYRRAKLRLEGASFVLGIFGEAIRSWRELRMILKGLLWTDHVVLAHLIVTRRCNLSCGYCNEYDHVSAPVPVEVLRQRVDKLAELGASIITISGGEPLLHPELEEVIRHIRRRGIIAGLITNGYLLTRERIRKLNEAGLEYLQISIDNVVPDEVSKKSLKVLDQKLVWLSELARFKVNINTVLGLGDRAAGGGVGILVFGRCDP